jgi:cyclophilin family peptidyl-prolyl cis-trans isomerase
MHYGKLIIGFGVLAIAFSCSRPIAQFAVEGEKQVLEKIQFNNQSEKATEYEWDFGDGNTSNNESPEHTYKSSGSYTIQLKAINEKGKSKIAAKEITVEPPRICLVELETRYGNMLIQLYDSTPKHQDNFIKLVEEGFYDSLLFHRVIQNFMVQGGDPQSKNAPADKSLGSGGPGYTIEAEFVDDHIHVKGALAAARTSDAVNPQKRSSGSQFYIVKGQPLTENQLKRIEAQKNIRYTAAQKEAYLANGGTPFLDREYTVFGQVIDGIEVIDKIAASATNERDRPTEDITMIIRLIR